MQYNLVSYHWRGNVAGGARRGGSGPNSRTGADWRTTTIIHIAVQIYAAITITYNNHIQEIYLISTLFNGPLFTRKSLSTLLFFYYFVFIQLCVSI